MKIDLSFIPQKMLTYLLTELIGEEINSPFRDISNADLSKSALLRIINERAIYFKLRSSLIEFAEEQYIAKNFVLSKQCFKYLVEINEAISRGEE